MQTHRFEPLTATRLPPGELSERVRSRLGSALDRTLLRATQVAVDAMLVPRPAELPALRASAEPLRTPPLMEEPWRFFAFPAAPAPLAERPVRTRSIRDGRIVTRELDFAYPGFPEAAAPDAPPRMERILADHWMHDTGRPTGTVVAVHGYRMGRPHIDATPLMARRWFAHGLDVVLVTLPFHGVRTPPEARFSGEHFAVPHMGRLAEAVRQAVYELRLLFLWLREREAGPVGFLGQSLGGYLVALMAGLYDDLDFAIPIVPPACMGDLAWRFFSRSRRYRRGLPSGFSRDELRDAFRVHSPLAHPLRVARERVLIVAGRGDRIVPPEHPSTLWAHWGEPAIHWFPGSHLAPFGRSTTVRAILDHLERLGIAAPR